MIHRILTTPWRATAMGALFLTLLLLVACGSVETDDGSGAPAGQALYAPGDSDTGAVADGSGNGPADVSSLSERKITLSATVRLRVEDIPAAVQQVEDIATTRGGFVSSSDLSINSDEHGSEQTGTMNIRVPSASYTEVVRDLRGLATRVDSESSQATEVTAEYTDLEARLRNLDASEARYLELLNRAETVDEILTVQDRVNSTRLEIEQVQGRLNVLNDLTDLATISVELRLPPLVASNESDGWAQEAVQTSWEVTRTAIRVFGTIAIATAFLLPWILIPALVVAGGWRLFGRRIAATMERISKV